MTAKRNTIHKEYTSKRAYLSLKGAIINQQNMRQVPIDFNCRIDTGFDGGVLIPQWHLSEAESIGIQPSITNMTLADGSKIPVYVFAAHIQEIEGKSLPSPGLPVLLVMCGKGKTVLLGMDTLKNSTILFDGPSQAFTLDF